MDLFFTSIAIQSQLRLTTSRGKAYHGLSLLGQPEKAEPQ